MYTKEQLEIAKKFHEFYFQINEGAKGLGWDSICMSDSRKERWYREYLKPSNYTESPGDMKTAMKAKKLTEEFFKEKNIF